MTDDARPESLSRPGVLYHESLQAPDRGAYQAHIVTTVQYGSKVAGLLFLPSAWVPPFAALPAWLSQEWQANKAGWLDTAKSHGIDLGPILEKVTNGHRYDVILRSSAVGEGLEDRGQYLSLKLEADAGEADAVQAIEKIFGGLVDRGRHASMGVCIQRHVEPELLGHVSNEVRLSSTRNQWKYEIELPTYVPNKGLNSKFAYPPAENEPPRARNQKSLRRALRGVCHWVNLRVGNRAHLEWCVSAGRLWTLQLDEESPTSRGENPHLMPPTHFGQPVPAPADFSYFHRYKIEDETPWKKLNNVRDFWVGAQPPKHRLFYATAEELKPILAAARLRDKLAHEIDFLTCSRAVLRTDCRDPAKRGFNLPRTHTVSGNEAVKWLAEIIRAFEAEGVSSRDFAFILHQYIPARAAAWSYFDPGDSIVRIDCLWGLPDGLQFLSHDSFELDAKTGAELSADVRFKRHFLQEQADGAWRYVPVARQFSRDRVLHANDLREIALTTVAVANRLSERTQIMWFCDLAAELELGKHLPWYRSRDYLTHAAVERPAFPTRQIRTLNDLNQLSDDGRAILQLQPTADLIRADDQYLDKVIEVATSRGLPVELPGSILGHAYYRLRDAGIMVLSDQPKYRRARGKTSYRKLVRDAIPANIAAGGERVSFGRLARDEAVTALVGKLFEEGLEVSGARDRSSKLEELADVLEVLRGLAALENLKWDEIENVANSKREKRGGFEKQTVLIETERPRRSATAEARIDDEGENAALVPLHNIGLISASEGHLAVPFTRIIPEGGLRAEVPFEGGKLAIRIRATDGGIVLDIDSIHDDTDPTTQPSLFEDF